MTRSLRIITLNTWKCDGRYRDRLGWMAQGLEALSPDVVCLQESFVCEKRNADTASHLADALGAEMHVLPSRRKQRFFEGEARDSWSNLAILSQHSAKLHPPIKLAVCTQDRDRWAMTLTLLPEGAPALKVVNTHLTHVQDAEGLKTRQQQAIEIGELCCGTETATVLCGDFNDLWDRETLAPLAALQWATADTEIRGGTMQGEYFGLVAAPRRIDQVQLFDPLGAWRLRKRWPCLNQPVGSNGEFPSDHAALAMDITQFEESGI